MVSTLYSPGLLYLQHWLALHGVDTLFTWENVLTLLARTSWCGRFIQLKNILTLVVCTSQCVLQWILADRLCGQRIGNLIIKIIKI
jgi:hypothetical protein